MPPKKRYDNQLTVPVSTAMKQRLQDVADREESVIAEVVRKIITAALNEKELPENEWISEAETTNA